MPIKLWNIITNSFQLIMIWKFACDLRVSVTTFHKICKSRIIPESLKWLVHLIRFNLTTHLSILITFSRCIIFSWFSFLCLYKTINYTWCEFHKIWLLFACSFAVVGSCFVVDWIFSLGIDDIIECATDPQQHIEHISNQASCLTIPIPFSIKFTFIYNLYTCMAICF